MTVYNWTTIVICIKKKKNVSSHYYPYKPVGIYSGIMWREIIMDAISQNKT